MKIKVEACQCNVCEHVWLPREPDPLCCAKCKTPYWDRQKNVYTPKRRKKSKQ